MAPKTAKQAAVAARTKFVDFVNPKLFNFSKPFLLAVLVGSTTAGLTAVMYFNIISTCNTFTTTTDTFSGLDRFFENNPPSCFLDVQVIDVAIETLPCEPATHGDCGYFSTGRVRYERCNPTDGSTDIPWPENWTPCETYFGNPTFMTADACPNRGILAITGQYCPEPSAAFGAALGYAGWFEAAMTVLFVLVLARLGLIKKDYYALKVALGMLDDDDAEEQKEQDDDAKGQTEHAVNTV